jgi:uncharacterized membrane protein YhaH (DUF805 family)
MMSKYCKSCGAASMTNMIKCPRCGQSDWSTVALAPMSPTSGSSLSRPASGHALSNRPSALPAATGPIAAVQAAIKGTFSFTGRSSRSEYWYFVLFYNLAAIMLGFLLGFVASRYGVSSTLALVLGVVSIVFLVWIAVANLAVQIRRLHDLDKTGWFVLLFLVPIVGGIIIFIWNCSRGSTGNNRFGHEPFYY